MRSVNCAPLKPPRHTSYGVVTSDVDDLRVARKVRPAELHAVERRVVLVGAESEHGEAVGSAVLARVQLTPGSVAAIAARSPIWFAPETRRRLSIARSVPLMSGAWLVVAPHLVAMRRDAHRVEHGVDPCSFASATRISSSATRLISKRLAAKPSAANVTK